MTTTSSSRRKVLLGLGAAVALAPSAASAQFGNILGGAGIPGGDLVGAAMNAMEGAKFSEGDELTMGGSYYEQFINQSGGKYNSRGAQQALRSFADGIFQTTQRPALGWEITLIDNETVNAWALPGGKIGVYKGLIRYCATPEELSAIICHEMAHAEFSHALQQMKNKAFTESMGGFAKQAVVNRVARGDSSGMAGFVTGEVLTALQGPIYGMITSGYGRDLEYKADAHIVPVFARNNYDLSRSTAIYETMLKIIPTDTKATTSLYSTHPGTKERIKRLSKAAEKEKQASIASVPPPGWDVLKRSFPTRNHFRLS